MSADHEGVRSVEISHVTAGGAELLPDSVAVEEPMEIRVGFGPRDARSARSLSVTMRTPGHDFELAAGFLLTEGIVSAASQIESIDTCGPPAPGRATSNIVRVDLTPDVEFDMSRLQRHFFTTSSCGICGKASLDAIAVQGIEPLDRSRPRVAAAVVHAMPERLRAAQPVFDSTGGLHAAALLDAEGTLIDVREDVGRHNAVDKVIGRQLLDGKTPLGDRVLAVSGRASFEILQKALVAGLPMIVAVGAPSSLAVEMAERFGATLVGFASNDRFNVYTVPERILHSST